VLGDFLDDLRLLDRRLRERIANLKPQLDFLGISVSESISLFKRKEKKNYIILLLNKDYFNQLNHFI
jgi:hypothetical protein